MFGVLWVIQKILYWSRIVRSRWRDIGLVFDIDVISSILQSKKKLSKTEFRVGPVQLIPLPLSSAPSLAFNFSWITDHLLSDTKGIPMPFCCCAYIFHGSYQIRCWLFKTADISPLRILKPISKRWREIIRRFKNRFLWSKQSSRCLRTFVTFATGMGIVDILIFR